MDGRCTECESDVRIRLQYDKIVGSILLALIVGLPTFAIYSNFWIKTIGLFWGLLGWLVAIIAINNKYK